jgi:hypothetical protein
MYQAIKIRPWITLLLMERPRDLPGEQTMAAWSARAKLAGRLRFEDYANECASHARTVPKPAMTGGLLPPSIRAM